ncbi:MAG: hypothetical protein ACLP8A_09325 [Methylovirgula sp.]
MRDEQENACAARNKAALGVLTVFASGLVFAAHADDLQPFRNVGDGYKSVKVITKYDVNGATHTMDLTAAEPNDASISRSMRVEIATQTVREICANHVLRGGWTIRIFLPGESAPAASCKTGSSRRRSG